MQNIWFIADTHFDHDNVIKYCNRPFHNTEDMNNHIIKKWNSTVGKYDKVFMLGDFAFNDKQSTINIIQQLQGNKILIKGNHDTRSNDFWLQAGFTEVSKYPILLTQHNIILSHQPVDISILTNLFNIHGHIHNKIQDHEIKHPDKYKCVSVENINYKPMSLIEILNHIKTMQK